MNKRLFQFVFLLAAFACNLNVWADELRINQAGILVKDDVPYKAIGVNYFNALYRTILNPADKTYIQGFDELARYQVPFIRVMFGGFWPNDLKLYQKDREAYLKAVDAFLEEAVKHGIGIVPSLNWNYAAVSDLVGEPASAWGKPDSKTIQFMRKYAQDLVKRYGRNSTIWMWEFGNEMTLYADLPNAKDLRPKVNPSKGTPAERTEADELSSADTVFAFKEFANTIKKINPHALLSTGNSLPRVYAYHNSFHRKWDSDTEEEFCTVLQRDNPSEYGVISIHVYPEGKTGYFGSKQHNLEHVLNVAERCAKQSKRPIFIGEFGVDAKRYGNDVAREKEDFLNLLSIIENSSVPLAALWVYDFSYQADTFNVTGASRRSYQLEAIQRANAKFGKSKYKP